VACEVVLVALALLRDPRIGGLPGISAGLGLALFVASLPPLARATHIVRAGQRPTEVSTAAKVYRTSARDPDRDLAERAATRYSAAALMLLAVAGAVTVVAAASR
jgi:hypothetical protein